MCIVGVKIIRFEVDINDAQIKEKRTRHGRGNPHSQLAMSDFCLPPIVAPKAPKVITAADVARYEACLPGLTGAAVTLCEITDLVGCNLLEGALGQAFASLDSTDWEDHEILFARLGFGCCLGLGCSRRFPE